MGSDIWQEVHALEESSVEARCRNHDRGAESTGDLGTPQSSVDGVVQDLSQLNVGDKLEAVRESAECKGQKVTERPHSQGQFQESTGASNVQGHQDQQGQLAIDNSDDFGAQEYETVAVTVTRKLEERLAAKKLMYDPPEPPEVELLEVGSKQTVVNMQDVIGSPESSRSTQCGAADKGRVLMALLDRRAEVQAELAAATAQTETVLAAKTRKSGAAAWPGTKPKVETSKSPKGQFSRFVEDVGASSEAHAPQPRRKRPAGVTTAEVLRNVQRLTQQQAVNEPAKEKVKGPRKQETSRAPILELLRDRLLDWCRADTLRFLSSNEDCRQEAGQDSPGCHLERLTDQDVNVEGTGTSRQKLPNMEMLRQQSAAFEVQVREFYQGKDVAQVAGSRKQGWQVSSSWRWGGHFRICMQGKFGFVFSKATIVLAAGFYFGVGP